MDTKPRFKKKVKSSWNKDYHFWSNNRKGPISIPEQHKKFYWGFKSCFKFGSLVFRTLLKPKLLLGFVNPHANLFTVGMSLFGHYISIILVKILDTKVIAYRLPALKASYWQFPLQFFEKYCHISHRWSTTQRHGWCNPSNTYWYFWAETLINGFLHYKNNRR